MHKWYRHSLRWLRGYPAADNRLLFNRFTQQYQEARMLVSVFYILILFFSFNQIVAHGINWLNLTYLNPLWPVMWLNWVSWPIGLYLLGSFSIASTLAVVLLPNNRWARLAVFLSFLQLVALINSFGKINHHLHAWVAVAFIFVFLPQGNWQTSYPTISQKRHFLLVFAATQAFFLSFYTLSGGWKLFAAWQQIQAGQTFHTLHPYAMAQQVAHRLIQTNSESVLGWIIIEYPWLGTFPYWLVVYIEVFALLAALRPSLHKLWGVLLILFHMGTWLTMTIAFNTNIILLGLFFLLSPFSPKLLNWTAIWPNLPVVYLFKRLWDGWHDS